MSKIAADLPFAQHAQTCISCTLCGEMMNDSNPPSYLPSGQLICQKSIDLLRLRYLKQQMGVKVKKSAVSRENDFLVNPFTNENVKEN